MDKEYKIKSERLQELILCCVNQNKLTEHLESLVATAITYGMIANCKDDFQKSLLIFLTLGFDFLLIENNITFDNYTSEPEEISKTW